MRVSDGLLIRLLDEQDPVRIADAFLSIGWNKSVRQFEQYLHEQSSGDRLCFVATAVDAIAGYVTVVWAPSRQPDVPEIVDLNVLPRFRNRGIGTALLDRTEAEVSRRAPVVGIAVGLHEGYGAAQRLYVRRGYVPDGRGVTYDGKRVEPYSEVMVDDSLTLNFTKRLTSGLAE